MMKREIAAPISLTVHAVIATIAAARADDDDGAYVQNAWGVAFTPAGSPFWVANNATGCSTLYDDDGAKVALQVSIPLPPLSLTVGA